MKKTPQEHSQNKEFNFSTVNMKKRRKMEETNERKS